MTFDSHHNYIADPLSATGHPPLFYFPGPVFRHQQWCIGEATPAAVFRQTQIPTLLFLKPECALAGTVL